MKYRFNKLILFTVVSLLIGIPASVNGQITGEYTLDGDDVLIEFDEYGARHLLAYNNVVLTYSFGGESWILTTDNCEFVETLDADGVPVTQVAHAEGNINLRGPDINITAPGRMDVDLVNRWVISDSQDIMMEFPDGQLTTDSVVIHESIDDDGVQMVTVNTDNRTVAEYNLSGSDVNPVDNVNGATDNIFGSLRFDFSTINIETERSNLVIVDGEPSSLTCPDPTVVTTAQNVLTLPSCEIGFEPPSLLSEGGIELLVGEDTSVTAGSLRMTYPREGGMIVRFNSAESYDPDAPLPDPLEMLVTITHPAGVFTAACITVTVNDDGTHRVEASGSTCFEIPLDMTGGRPGISTVEGDQ